MPPPSSSDALSSDIEMKNHFMPSASSCNALVNDDVLIGDVYVPLESSNFSCALEDNAYRIMLMTYLRHLYQCCLYQEQSLKMHHGNKNKEKQPS